MGETWDKYSFQVLGGDMPTDNGKNKYRTGVKKQNHSYTFIAIDK